MDSVLITYSDGVTETCKFDKGKYVVENGQVFDDALNMIVDCRNGNMKISFPTEQSKDAFFQSIKEDISNYRWFIKRGQEFMKQLLKEEF